jgi:hypothetical protein
LTPPGFVRAVHTELLPLLARLARVANW